MDAKVQPIVVKVSGGYSTDRMFSATAELVRIMVAQHLGEAGFSGEFEIEAQAQMDRARPGISYENVIGGMSPPTIAFVAQPAEVAQRWKWRLKLPKSLDAKQVFSELQRVCALERLASSVGDLEAFKRVFAKAQARARAGDDISAHEQMLESLDSKRQALLEQLEAVNAEITTARASLAAAKAILEDDEARQAAEMLAMPTSPSA